MAIIDNVKKFSDTVWELPSNYKNAFRSNRGARFRSLGASSRQVGAAHRRLQTTYSPQYPKAVLGAYVLLICWAYFHLVRRGGESD
jgi:hypothetical protein